MRTTVDLPDELLQQAREKAAREKTTLTAILTRGLRQQLSEPRPVAVRPLPILKETGGLRPGIDPNSNRSLLDAADDLL